MRLCFAPRGEWESECCEFTSFQRSCTVRQKAAKMMDGRTVTSVSQEPHLYMHLIWFQMLGDAVSGVKYCDASCSQDHRTASLVTLLQHYGKTIADNNIPGFTEIRGYYE